MILPIQEGIAILNADPELEGVMIEKKEKGRLILHHSKHFYDFVDLLSLGASSSEE